MVVSFCGKGESIKKSNIHYPRLRPNKLGLPILTFSMGLIVHRRPFPSFTLQISYSFPFASAPKSHPNTLNSIEVTSNSQFLLNSFFTHQFLKFRFSMKCNRSNNGFQFTLVGIHSKQVFTNNKVFVSLETV